VAEPWSFARITTRDVQQATAHTRQVAGVFLERELIARAVILSRAGRIDKAVGASFCPQLDRSTYVKRHGSCADRHRVASNRIGIIVAQEAAELVLASLSGRGQGECSGRRAAG